MKQSFIYEELASYKALRNKVAAMHASCQQVIFQQPIAKCRQKQSWKTMKYLRKEQSTVPVWSHDDCTANNDEDKASMLKSFFS